MSGLAGVVRFGDTVAAQELEAMLQPMKARGPDRQTLARHGEAGFCHALLATTPEATAGVQPWRHPETGCLVVTDSRLDNRPQLLRELGIDRPANEVGDCELVHAAWHRWREGCVDRLRGDFAFAIWDPVRHMLFLARDPMGMRPLQFHFDPGRLLVFGSCTDTVIAQGEVPATVDEGRIADALIGETEGIDQTSTFFSSVQKLPPAHWMRVQGANSIQQRYWRPVTSERPAGLPRTGQEWVEAQHEQLERAVQLRLRAARPVGSMLSGGLDSSSVVALAGHAHAETGAPPFPVFSATNRADPECPESRAILAVVASVGCKATLVDVQDFKNQRTRAHSLWEDAGEPFDGAMGMVAALYESAAAQGVSCVLDGLPADNLFSTGQLPRHLFKAGRWLDAWDAAVRQWQRPWVRFPRLHALRVMAGCTAPDFIHDLRDRLAGEREFRGLLRTSLIDHGFARRTGLKERYHRYRLTIGGSHQWHESGEALSSLAAPYISAALERYNRVASLYGIEPRSPFADRDLIEFQAWMPLELRHRDGHLKWVLRQAMADLLPPEVAWRRDKYHIGREFSRKLLMAASAVPSPPPTFPAREWLDQKRLTGALLHPTSRAAAGLSAALMLLSWWKARESAIAAARRLTPH